MISLSRNFVSSSWSVPVFDYWWFLDSAYTKPNFLITAVHSVTQELWATILSIKWQWIQVKGCDDFRFSSIAQDIIILFWSAIHHLAVGPNFVLCGDFNCDWRYFWGRLWYCQLIRGEYILPNSNPSTSTGEEDVKLYDLL